MLSIIQTGTTIVLVVITGVYVYLTKRILDSNVDQTKLLSNPIVGVTIGRMAISPVSEHGRRSFSVGLQLTNVGSGPAIDILVDAEILLQYGDVDGEGVIPARFEPASIPFLRPGEHLPDEISHSPDFGNSAVKHLLDDFQKAKELNVQRLATDPTQEAFVGPRLKICVYYRNNLEQYFVSTYETYLYLEAVPPEDKWSTLTQIYIPRPKFHAGVISAAKVHAEIEARNLRRHLSGW